MLLFLRLVFGVGGRGWRRVKGAVGGLVGRNEEMTEAQKENASQHHTMRTP